MLWTASKIKGYAISACDGKIGTVSDILFDDTNWLVRWLAVDIGTCLAGRFWSRLQLWQISTHRRSSARSS